MACGWDLSYAQCGGDSKYMDRVDDATQALAEEAATDLLNQWTGGAFGPCPFTIRPCYEPCDSTGLGEAEFQEAVVGGGRRRRWRSWVASNATGLNSWSTLACGACGYDCACGPDRAVSLQLPGPVHRVIRVVIGGQVLPDSAYRLEHGYLIRQDGKPWPTGQDLTQPESADGSWYVEYEKGLQVPAGGQLAAARLAVEIAKALCNDSSCALPKRVSSVSRQGVTIGAVLDSFEDLDQGRTGIWVVDSWVSSIKNAPGSGGRVYSADFNRGRTPVRRRAWR